MTTYFVDSAGSNTAPYDTEAKASTSIATIAALPWVAGDIVRVASTHAETVGASLTLSFPATPGLQVLSVTYNGSGTGALAVGGSVAIGAVSFGLTLGGGYAYIYGLTLAAGTNNNGACDLQIGNSSSPVALQLDNCTLSVPSINTGAVMSLGCPSSTSNDDVTVEMTGCTWSNGAQAGRSVTLRYGRFVIDDLALAGTAWTTLLAPVTAAGCNLLLTASDLTGVTWTSLIDASVAVPGLVTVAGCKMPVGWALTTGAYPGPGGIKVTAVDCASGDTHYNFVHSDWRGTVTATSSIYVDAGNGTDTISWLMESSANASFAHPLRSPPIQRFNATLAGMTVKVPIINDGTTYTDAQAWIEVLHKGTAGSPLMTWDRSDRAADILAAGTNQATDSSTWTGTGGFASPIKQELKTGTITPAEIGPLTAVVCLAKPSDNLYVSPRLEIA